METSYHKSRQKVAKGFLVRYRVTLLLGTVLGLIVIELIGLHLGWRAALRPHGLENPRDPYAWIGSLLVIAGLSCRSWAAATLIKSRRLATDGAYACCRHPLYMGSLLVLLGYCTLLGQMLATVMLLGVVLMTYPPTILREERNLAGLFPGEWPDYSRTVPAFIPRRLPLNVGAVSWRRWFENREYKAAFTGFLGLLGIQAWHYFLA